MPLSGKFATVAALAALGLGAWTVEAYQRYEHALEPLPIQRHPPRAVPGKRLHWSEVEVPARPPETEATAKRGNELFQQYCAECHGREGNGDGPAARAFNPLPRSFPTGEYRLKTTPSSSLPTPGDLYRTISTGILASRMPGFSHLAADDRWALVAVVISLTAVTNPDFDEKQPIDEDNWKTRNRYALNAPEAPIALPPAPPLDPEAPARGHTIFVREGCSKCHGDEGRGDGPGVDAIKDLRGIPVLPADYTRLLTHSKGGADRADVFRDVTTGLAIMPAFSQVSEKDRWDVAAWVRSKAAPDELTPPKPYPELADDRAIFAKNCAGCHGPDGHGDGPALGFLDVEPRDLTSAIYKWKSTPVGELPCDEDLERILQRGVPGTAMPSWLLMPEVERVALVRYLKFIAPRFKASGRVPRAPISVPFAPRDLETPARIAQGKELYESWGCTRCHGERGRGDGPLAPVLQDIWGYPVRPRDLVAAPLHAGEAPEDTYRVLTVGVEGTPMPAFGVLLSEDERYSLVAYVRDLRHRGVDGAPFVAPPKKPEGVAPATSQQ